jgi:hypothetical protein
MDVAINVWREVALSVTIEANLLIPYIQSVYNTKKSLPSRNTKRMFNVFQSLRYAVPQNKRYTHLLENISLYFVLQ